ncbi:heterokaryon incompatibility protein-domain-containing protein [Paraphoma chrysanthemicola]|nr:heterokaryon incompatibility protein-domain-containing protein [Paraphoma chrysanthemicola]
MFSNDPLSKHVRLRPSLIDLQQLRSWRHECLSKHGEECNNRYSELLSKRLETLTLVDVNDHSLVILPSTTPFVALSYVWGSVPMFKAMKSNMSSLMKPGSLVSDEIKIADTVRDAIYLVKNLGECYLWVDCLCIIQDQDDATMSAMLRAMANIYASAEFTIAAADGADANYGLRGTGGLSADLSQLDVDQRPFYVERYPFRSTWASRGWTFQESLFSRRLLVFGKTLTWFCGRSEWNEFPILDDDRIQEGCKTVLITPSKRRHLGVPMGLLSQITELPCLGAWCTIIDEYSQRCLTYDSDFHRAIAGATEILGPIFPGGLVHGLPIFFFDMVLLWQPQKVFSRRSDYPSWSWTGWNAKLTTFEDWFPFCPSLQSQYGDVHEYAEDSHTPSARLSRVATYMMQEITNTGVGQWHSPRHLNEFYDYLAIRYDTKAKLPTSWSRHDHEGDHYYTCSISKDTERRFSFPLPFADTRPTQVNYSPVILCTAPYALVNIREHPSFGNLGILTESNLGALLGAVQFSTASGLSLDICDEVHVVALSETEVVNGVFMKGSLQEPVMYDVLKLVHQLDGDVQEPLRYYNAMCIIWEDDVAVRVGLGMVHKKAWDDLHAQTITFKLR